MTCNPTTAKPRRRSWRQFALVLGPMAAPLLATVFGASATACAPLWLGAIAWTVLASFALALHSALCRGDTSAFTAYRQEPDRQDAFDLDTRTGAYSWMRERDERFLSDDPDRLH